MFFFVKGGNNPSLTMYDRLQAKFYPTSKVEESLWSTQVSLSYTSPLFVET